MIIIISSAKTFDERPVKSDVDCSTPLFLKELSILVNKLVHSHN